MIEAGNVVRLVGGGPLMTVERITDNNKVATAWFEPVVNTNGDVVSWNGPYKDYFDVPSLEKVRD